MPRPSFSRLSVYAKLLLELVLFAVTTGVLAYFSETHEWRPFVLATSLAAALFLVSRLFDSKAVIAAFKRLEDREFELAAKFESFGIVRLYNMQEPTQQDARNEDTRRVIASAASMNLAANSAASYIDPGIERHWAAVKQRLDQGVPFNIVVLDPRSAEKEVRDRLNLAGEGPDAKLRFDLLVRLYNEYSHVHIRVAPSNMYCTVFFTDTAMFFDPYHLAKQNDRITNRFMCFQFNDAALTGGRESYFALLRRHFEALWAMSEDLGSYVSQNSEEMERLFPRLPMIKQRYRK